MKICQNCGAELDDHMVVCPYCGTENIREAVKEHRDQLNEIYARTEDVKYLKERIARKATRVTGYVAAGIVAFFGILVLCTLVYSRIHAATALARQNKDLEMLESLYQEGRYDEMSDYLDKVENGYTDTFEKYSRVSRATQYLDSNIEYLEDVLNYAKENDREEEEFIAYGLYNTFWWLEQAQKCEDEGYPYGEEAGIRYALTRYREALAVCELTEEEYREAIQWIREGAQEDAFLPLAGQVLKRISE